MQNDKCSTINFLKVNDISEDEMKAKALSIDNVKVFTCDHEILKVIVIPKKLVNIVIK